ncbi:hypothetical protein Asi02nite_37580 [Asanoa siamensis]|uniref:Uncharacterized protein n=1 Tax=Asanoa siamensis TaxID=926357 RepID=A0ABQ4CSH9_9ACTN|nr:hypothetical protein Asi02nite_37580 [Asanoa siamensis]
MRSAATEAGTCDKGVGAVFSYAYQEKYATAIDPPVTFDQYPRTFSREAGGCSLDQYVVHSGTS